MKFALVAVLAAFALVAVSANAMIGGVDIEEEFDFQYVPVDVANEEPLDPDTLIFVPNIFAPIYWVIKGALRTVKGLNCTIKGVINIKNSAETFVDDVQACGGVVSQQVQSVINASKTVISTSNNIIQLNDDACKSGNSSDEYQSTKKTPYKCFLNILHNMLRLKNQINQVISLVKKVPDATTGAGACVHTALTDLTSVFTQFPAMVKTCSKLTN